jgi:hypothetical protein
MSGWKAKAIQIGLRCVACILRSVGARNSDEDSLSDARIRRERRERLEKKLPTRKGE